MQNEWADVEEQSLWEQSRSVLRGHLSRPLEEEEEGKDTSGYLWEAAGFVSASVNAGR